ncbi:DNA primase [Gallibacterium genomosp. 3]|uniref:DNA primase n=1 Tax=Gallibacterium genomosp. 3 TaxID=505345 RepID=A0A1A7Q0V0_9PAST|nr:DNA primase [Gallibacterium genomosp. 3]OBX07035.1 DNA primase [Gallibacterium genomosp. 3]
MKGLIPRTFIDELLARTNIVDVVNSRVKLKKAGQNYQACCPFHHEKTPSFTVSAKKQFYHCFGCGAHGNAISFLMDYDKLEFVEAIEELAALQGVDVPRENTFSHNNSANQNYKSKRDLHQLMQDIAVFYQQQLTQALPAQAYLQQRGLSTEVIQRFAIGFASGTNSVLRHFGQSPEDRQKLLDTGMITQNDFGTAYDRFRQRIMFPIRDRRGRTIAFGGRVLGDEKPKYLNSPEMATYHKGSELYGLYEALEQNDNPDYLLVVEGYMDVVALAQFGVTNAVASLGTATTGEQIQIAYRATEQIICCYDGDNAGRSAAWRALENALPHLYDGRQLKFIFLPDGEDPDTFIRQIGKEKFEEFLLDAMPMSDFLFQHLLTQVDLSTKDGRSKLAALAVPLIDKIPGETLRLYLRNMLGQKLGIMDAALLEKMLPSMIATATETQKENEARLKATPMRLLIALLLQNPELADKPITRVLLSNPQVLQDLNLPGLSLFLEVYQLCIEKSGITTGQLLEYWRGKTEEKIIEKLAIWDHLIKDDNIEATFYGNLKHLHSKVMEKRIEALKAKDRTDTLSLDEKKELMELLANSRKLLASVYSS